MATSLGDMALCDIPVTQNSPKQLERLAAFTRLYGHAKTILAIQFVITVPVALITSTLAAVDPRTKVWTTFCAITIALIDALILDRVQVHFRKLAARVQEQFDCDLFQLPWNGLKAGPKPDSEDVLHAAAKHHRKHPDISKLQNWYPAVVADLPIEFARLVCQRAASWWDSNLRKTYANGLIVLLVVLVVAVIAISLFCGLKVEDMLLTVYVPIAPAVLWSVREVRKQREAADSLDKLRSHIEKVWNEAISGQLAAKYLSEEARRIQDSLFDGRSRNPLIFDWIYNWLRDTNETGMSAKAVELVAEARGKLLS